MRIFSIQYESLGNVFTTSIYFRDNVAILDTGWLYDTPIRLGEPCTYMENGQSIPFDKQLYNHNSWLFIWKWSKKFKELIPVALNEQAILERGYREEKKPFRLSKEYIKKRHDDYRLFFEGIEE